MTLPATVLGRPKCLGCLERRIEVVSSAKVHPILGVSHELLAFGCQSAPDSATIRAFCAKCPKLRALWRLSVQIQALEPKSSAFWRLRHEPHKSKAPPEAGFAFCPFFITRTAARCNPACLFPGHPIKLRCPRCLLGRLAPLPYSDPVPDPDFVVADRPAVWKLPWASVPL